MEPLCAGDWREYGADASCTARRRGRGKSIAGGVQPRRPARNHLRFALHLVLAHAYSDVQKADMFHMSAFFFGHRFAGRVRRGHRAMRAADGGPQPTIERSCPRGRRLRAAGQTAQAKWIAARLKTLSNHGPAGPI